MSSGRTVPSPAEAHLKDFDDYAKLVASNIFDKVEVNGETYLPCSRCRKTCFKKESITERRKNGGRGNVTVCLACDTKRLT